MAEPHPITQPQRIAVIGGGIAGLATAWILAQRHEVTLYERESRLGGHSHTLSWTTPEGVIGLDCGFVVYNTRNYPHFTRILESLDIETQPSDMSFSVRFADRGFEWAGSGWRTFFASPQGLFDPLRWRLFRGILAFSRQARTALAQETLPADLTLGDFLASIGMEPVVAERYLLPMAASIWSSPPASLLDHPARTLLQFLDHHGLLKLRGRPRWRSIPGGSIRYVQALRREIRASWRLGEAVTRIIPQGEGVLVLTENGGKEHHDRAVLACHADQAHALLDRSCRARSWLQHFSTVRNHAWIHQDEDLMPRRRALWSSWNFFADTPDAEGQPVAITYWLNRLQRLGTPDPYFVTLNREPRPGFILSEMAFEHPCYRLETLRAQAEAPRWQGLDRLYYAGAWLGSGFHEDGAASAAALASCFRLPLPWNREAVVPVTTATHLFPSALSCPPVDADA
jgi:predicted NAD/FAD-binding protein